MKHRFEAWKKEYSKWLDYTDSRSTDYESGGKGGDDIMDKSRYIRECSMMFCGGGDDHCRVAPPKESLILGGLDTTAPKFVCCSILTLP